jgi:hypothetical protein
LGLEVWTAQQGAFTRAGYLHQSRCMNDELAAQQELTKKWSTFKAGPQAVCTQETTIGGAPSYVELITCLELDQQAGQAAIENKKGLNTPSTRPAKTKATPEPK